MPGFQVDTNELAAGQGHHDVIAGTIGGSAGLLRAAAAAIAEGAGHAGASAAGADWGAAWEAELAGRAEVLRRTGQNLAAAADAYRETDDGQMRG
jgi:uncharacterized protein YukE